MSALRQRATKARATSPAAARPTEVSAAAVGGAEDVPSGFGWRAGLAVLLGVRLLSAGVLMITDCDETFNYWEPTHYTLYGWGFQTWEYSPAYALRSYFFLLPHSVAVSALHTATGSKLAAFYGARALQGLASWHLERHFCEAIATRFGTTTATATLWLLAGSAGMFHASTAFLPSSFTMLAVLGIWTAWLRDAYGPAIIIAVYTILLVWPFAVLLYVPLGLTALFAPDFGLLKVLRWGIVSSLLLGGVDMAYNTMFYGKPLLASWEIFYYNVLQDNGGPELYGTEPASFYAVNLALNFNGALVLAAVLPATLPLASLFGRANAKKQTLCVTGCKAQLVYLAPLYVWFCFYSSLPHKEERFLAPCYPLLCAAAAASLGGSICTHAVLISARGAHVAVAPVLGRLLDAYSHSLVLDWQVLWCTLGLFCLSSAVPADPARRPLCRW